MLFHLITLPLITFTISMCITPGPNNIMLAASGANYGFKRTIPHILGIEIGMIGLFALSAFGLAILFELFPEIQLIMKITSSLYLFYFAYKITFAKRNTTDQKNNSTPLSFLQAALFQLINPKAVIITSSALSSFSQNGDLYVSSALAIVIVFSIICLPAISLWAGFGSFLSKFLNNNIIAFRSFNICLGTLTALSVLMIIL